MWETCVTLYKKLHTIWGSTVGAGLMLTCDSSDPSRGTGLEPVPFPTVSESWEKHQSILNFEVASF